MQTIERFFTSADPKKIWQVLADVQHWPDWTPTVLEVKPLIAGDLRTGAQYLVTQPQMRPAIYEVTECIPGESFTRVRKVPGGDLIADHRIAKAVTNS